MPWSPALSAPLRSNGGTSPDRRPRRGARQQSVRGLLVTERTSERTALAHGVAWTPISYPSRVTEQSRDDKHGERGERGSVDAADFAGQSTRGLRSQRVDRR